MSVLEHTAQGRAAIEADERYFAHRLLVDWDNDASYAHPLSDLSSYVVETKRDQSLNATAPDELQLIEGNAAAKLTATLSGTYDGVSLAAHFAPYNGLSIFYREGIALGVSMRYEIAIDAVGGWEWYPQFVGVVRDVLTDRETNTVELACLDNVERLRTATDIPPYALFQGYLQDGYKRGMLIDSSSVIDLAARSGNFVAGAQKWAHYQGEPEVDGVYGPLLSVPLHGSILPEVGTLDGDCTFHLTEDWESNAFAYRAEAYTAGPHGYLALNAVPPERTDWGYKKYWLDEWGEQGGSLIGRSWVLGCWLYWEAPNASPDSAPVELRIRESYIQLVVEGSNGGVAARVRENNGLVTTSTYLFMSPGWNYLQATFEFETTAAYAMQVRVNEQTAAENRFEAQNLTNTGDVLSGLAKIENFYVISDVYITGNQDNTWLGSYTYDATPQDTARVSWGRNRLAYTLRESGLEGWQLAKDVASAEFGAVLFDEVGRFVSWNYNDLTERQGTIVRTFTIDDLQALKLRNTFDSVRNVWTVETRSGRAVNSVLYDLGEHGVPLREDSRSGELVPDVFQIPPSTAKEWFVPTDDHAISVYPFGIPNIQQGANDAPGYWDQYVPTHGKMTYTGTDFRHNTSDRSEQKFVNRRLFRLWVWNGWADPVGFVDPNGSPRFRVQGLSVREDQPRTLTIRDESSVDAYGERVFELPRSFWLQDEWQTRAMLQTIVDRLGRPIPVSENITVPGDPRVQIGDTLELRDAQGFGERMTVQVYGIVREFSDEGLRDTYTIEQISSAGVGIWDSATYGLWDQSLIWS